MSAYLVNLKVQGRICVVVGGGHVAARKVKHLLKAGAHVTVVSPSLSKKLAHIHDQETFDWIRAELDESHIAQLKPFLLIAATNSATVNIHAQQLAHQYGALVNIVDTPEVSDFHNVTQMSGETITIGVSTEGNAPALALRVRDVIKDTVGQEYDTLATWLSDLREWVKLNIPTLDGRKNFYQTVIESDILTLLQNGETQTAREQLHTLQEKHT